MNRIASIALCAALAAPAAAAPRRKAAAPADKTMVDASFDAALPSAWTAERRRDGVSARSPGDESGVGSVITLRYLPPDGPEKSIDSYLARQAAAPVVPVHGWSVGKPEDARVAGRAAKRLVNLTSEFTPPTGAPPREVLMREEHVLVPAKKGFYLLLFYAPRSRYEKEKAVFERVVASFKPKL